MRRNGDKKILIALEVSYVGDRNDVDRAFKKAEIIFKAYGIECIPAIIGEEYIEGANSYAEEIGVLLI